MSLLVSALEALKLDYLNKGSEVSLSALSFAEAEFVQARTDRTKCGGDYKKEKTCDNCNSTASHCNNCMKSFDKGYNRQFHCLVGKDVSFVSLQAQLKRHHIVKQDSFSTVMPGRYTVYA